MAAQTQVKDAKTLNNALLDAFNKLKDGKIELDVAKELSNSAGKIIKLNIGRLDYAKATREKPNIDFWNE